MRPSEPQDFEWIALSPSATTLSHHCITGLAKSPLLSRSRNPPQSGTVDTPPLASLSLPPVMFRKHVPDLDSLESPLISANPFGSVLGVVPGSALAERIFNDPGSWQGADDDEGDLEDGEAMTWLAEEVERSQANGDELCLSPVDRDVDLMLKPFSERFKLAATPESDKQVNWDGIAQDGKKPFLPLFDHTSLDLSLNLDLRLSMIWDAKGKMFNSTQSPLSPANDAKTLPSVAENTRTAAPPALDLSSTDNTHSPILSPLAVASASTTWSILEWYGVHPNTPRANGRVPLLTHYPPTPYHSKPPALSSLRAPSSPSANTTVLAPPPPPSRKATPPPPSRKATPPPPEPTSIRRLPVIPDPARNSPSPTPSSRAPTPPRTRSPEQTPLRVKSSELSATSTPNRSATTPRRTPRGSATLPAPSASPDSFNSSPNVTPIRSGSLFTRSPPAGPRPRSGTPPVRQHQASRRASPSPIVIAPAPAPTRARRPTPPPGLRLGVPA
ncbi:hypothetical protein DXG01_000707 [Tephrocybe rancida]|nr:hypothetical protein DXG01_000707 [Tephrocybe rancida]